MKAKPQDVKLRPIRLSDAPRYVKWLNDPAITNNLSVNPGLTLRQEKVWIKKAIIDPLKKSLAIIYKGEHVGGVALDKIDPINKNAEFGIFIGNKKYWGLGIGTIATKKMVAYRFDKLKLHKIYLRVTPHNKKAIYIYQKLGFKKEGYLKHHVKKSGQFKDQILMAIIKK